MNLAVLWILLILGGAAWAEQSALNEYKIKLALIYNFMKFIDWPKDRAEGGRGESPMTLAYYGDDEVFDLCTSMQEKTVKNRRIRVIRIFQRDFLDTQSGVWSNVDILYLAEPLPDIGNLDKKALLTFLRQSNVLTVGEEGRFLEMGGIIQFLREENHIKFEINLDLARDAKLEIKTSMLKLAKRVIQKQDS